MKTQSLAKLDRARAALVEAKTLEDIIAIRDVAAAAAAFAKAAKLSGEAYAEALEIKRDAERRAGQKLAELERPRGGKPDRGVGIASPYAETLATENIHERQAQRWQRLADMSDEEFAANQASMRERITRLADRNGHQPAVRQPPPPLPAGVYDILVADPPWRYEFVEADNRAIENQYPTMELDEIAALDVPAADNAVLFLWATAPKTAEALHVLNAWGFTYRTNLVWVKDRIGMGYWARSRHELLLVGAKGSPKTPAEADRPDSVIEAPRLRHSEKPSIVYELIETAFPTGRYLEIFSRKERDGWTSWGNEVG